MKTTTIGIVILLICCYSSKSQYIKENRIATMMDNGTVYDSIKTKSVFKTIILPPYDEIAGKGSSPDVDRYLKSVLKSQKEIAILPIDYKQAVYMIFDKKYLKQIIDTIHPDAVIMSKLKLSKGTGNMASDLWDIKIRLYISKSDKQIDLFHAEALTNGKIRDTINSIRGKIVKAIVE
jgi:hypothetical protein